MAFLIAEEDLVVEAVELVAAKARAGHGAVALELVEVRGGLHPVHELFAGDLDHEQGVVIVLVQGIAVTQADVAGGLALCDQAAEGEVLVCDRGGHGDDVLLGRVDIVVEAGGPDLRLVDEVVGVALSIVVVGGIFPGAGDGADLGVDEGVGLLELLLHQGLQAVVGLVAGGEVRRSDSDGLAVGIVAEGIAQSVLGRGAGRDGDLAVSALGQGQDGLGNDAAAAVHDDDILTVLVLDRGGVLGVVVAGQEHIVAGGVGDEIGGLVFLVEGIRSALAAVRRDDDVVALRGQLFGVALILPDVGLFGVVGVTEGAALIVAGDVPVGVVHVLQAEQADGELGAVGEFVGEGLVRGEDGFLALRLDDVGADDADRGAGQGGVGGFEHIVEVPLNLRAEVELVVAEDEGVIADVAQGDRHRAVHAVLLQDIVAAQGAALQNVADVDNDAVIDLCAALEDDLRGLQIVFAQRAVGVGVPVVCTAVHIRGGHDADGDRVRFRVEDGVLLRSVGVALGGERCVDRGELCLHCARGDDCQTEDQADDQQEREKTACGVSHVIAPPLQFSAM